MSLYYFTKEKAHRVARFNPKFVWIFCHREKDGSFKAINCGSAGPTLWSGDILKATGTSAKASESLCMACEEQFEVIR